LLSRDYPTVQGRASVVVFEAMKKPISTELIFVNTEV
jgi:hypothetical protein